MANQRSDAPREFADKRSEVLSDSTDLDALLSAILGDDVAPVPAAVARPEATVGAGREASVVVWPGPTLVSPPRIAPQADSNAGDSAVTEAEADEAWADNLRESLAAFKKQDLQGTAQGTAATEPVPVIESPIPVRTWRDVIPVPTTKQSLLIAGLSAATLIVLGAMSLRGGPDDRVVPPSPAAALPGLVPPASAVEPPSRAPAIAPATVEGPAARNATAKPRVITPPSPGRASERTEPVRTEVPPRNVQPPTVAPVSMPPAAVQRVVDEPSSVAPPTRTTAPASNPRPATSAPAPTVAAPPAAPPVTSAAPTAAAAQPAASTPVASVPAAAARRTAPRLLEGPAPEYPAALRTAKVGGNVEVRFAIDSGGRTINVQSVSGPQALRAAAEAAVRRWRYEPAQLGNVAVETQTSVNFNFDPSAARRPQD